MLLILLCTNFETFKYENVKKIKTSISFIAAIQMVVAIIASKEILCYTRNFLLTVRSVLNSFLLGY